MHSCMYVWAHARTCARVHARAHTHAGTYVGITPTHPHMHACTYTSRMHARTHAENTSINLYLRLTYELYYDDQIRETGSGGQVCRIPAKTDDEERGVGPQPPYRAPPHKQLRGVRVPHPEGHCAGTHSCIQHWPPPGVSGDAHGSLLHQALPRCSERQAELANSTLQLVYQQGMTHSF